MTTPAARAAAVAVLAAFALHQDQWFWHTAQPVVFGLLPAGLWYHALYAVGCAALMWWLSRTIWPSHLDPD
jgi:hypothetical protein